MSERVIVWADVETSGLSPYKHRLLEIACLVTDYDLNILDPEGYHAVLYAPDERRNADPYVRKMHENSGLWTKCESVEAKTAFKVNEELLAYLLEFAPTKRSARLAGNSVRLDANFIDAYLPSVSEHLHYRILDVSSLGFEAYDVRGIPQFAKELRHEAMSDIRESIEELRYLRSELYGERVIANTQESGEIVK